jgi:hypothetical protein
VTYISTVQTPTQPGSAPTQDSKTLIARSSSTKEGTRCSKSWL